MRCLEVFIRYLRFREALLVEQQLLLLLAMLNDKIEMSSIWSSWLINLVFCQFLKRITTKERGISWYPRKGGHLLIWAQKYARILISLSLMP
jgi:hypothetical protein